MIEKTIYNTASEKSNRIAYIDYLKFFAIVCVVIGHIIQYNDNNFDNNHLFRYIYSFHMPLFMMISGYISIFSNKTIISTIKKRIIQLIIPFFAYGMIDMIIHEKMSLNSILHLLKYPAEGLWFLWVLFFISIFSHISWYIANTFKYNSIVTQLVTFIILYSLNKVFNGLYGSDFISWYFIFFTIGKYIPNLDSSKLTQNMLVPIFFFFLFALLGFYWKRMDFIIDLSSNLVRYKSIFLLVYKMVTALAGCFFFWLLWRRIKISNSFIQHKIQYIGQITLGIYAIHFYYISLFTYLFNSLQIQTSVFMLTLEFIVVFILSYYTVFILKKNKITSLLFLGNLK